MSESPPHQFTLARMFGFTAWAAVLAGSIVWFPGYVIVPVLLALCLLLIYGTPDRNVAGVTLGIAGASLAPISLVVIAERGCSRDVIAMIAVLMLVFAATIGSLYAIAESRYLAGWIVLAILLLGFGAAIVAG